MWRPTLRQLEYLVAVEETGRFGEAARRCAVSQPALSKQIREVEEGLGLRLFERGRQGARATREGEVVLAHARQVLGAARALTEAAAALGDPLAGELRLAAIPTLAPYVLPPLVDRVRSALPSLRLRLFELETESIRQALAEGTIDAGLVALPWAGPGLEARSLFEDELLLAAPPGHPLAGDGPIPAARAAAAPLLLLREGHCLREHALEACPSDRDADLEASSLSTLIAMVRGSWGAALVPELARSRDLQGLSLRPLSPRAWRTVALWFRPGTSRRVALDRLAEILEGVGPEAQSPAD